MKKTRIAVRQVVLLFFACLIFILTGCDRLNDAVDGLSNIAEDAQLVIVSLGDSYASGEGNPDVTKADGGPSWLLNPMADATLCHRSLNNGHRLAVAAIEEAWPHSDDVRFQSFACAGATMTTGLLGPQFSGGLCSGGTVPVNCSLSQIEQAAAWKNESNSGILGVDVVIVSIGGNDVGFPKIVEQCSNPLAPPCDKNSDLDTMLQMGCGGSPPPINGCRPGIIGLDNLHDAYTAVIFQIQQQLEPKHIILVGYPDPTRDFEGNFCDRWDDGFRVGPNLTPGTQLSLGPFEITLNIGAGSSEVTYAESEWSYTAVLNPLNLWMETAAGNNDVEFVSGMDEATRQHGACAESYEPLPPPSGERRIVDERWFLTFRDSWTVQGDLWGTMHPNKLGHETYATHIAEKLRVVLGLPESS